MDKDFNFKNWQLPFQAITELYKNDITIIPADSGNNRNSEIKEVKAETLPNSGQLQFLGGNNKKITIIVNSPDNTWLPDEELRFLYKITGAVQLNASDLAIINLFKQKADIGKIKSELNPEKILMFGISGEEIDLPIEFPEFHVQLFDSIYFLKSPQVKVLMEEKTPGTPLKNQLWGGLKKMFLSK